MVREVKAFNDLGFYHRNITPDSFYLDETFHTIKLCNFGHTYFKSMVKNRIAPLLHHGDYLYTSPERLRDEVFHQEPEEVWALGVCLYEMLVHKHPFVWWYNDGNIRFNATEKKIKKCFKYADVVLLDKSFEADNEPPRKL
jgi:serine/threonine protein kinase